VSIRVLLVDDVPEARRLVRTALRFHGEFAVVGEASSGEQAITLTRTLRPDVVVLDIGLPDLAGQDVLTQIRAHAPQTRVIVFSATALHDGSDAAPRADGDVLQDSDLDHLVALLDAVGSRGGQRTLRLDGSVTSARRARAFTAASLDAWEVTDVLDDTLLVVTELVNNAVTHVGGECELRILLTPQSLRVEVADHGAGTPDPLPASPTRSHGRGLHIVDALTAGWGFEALDDGGKLVWAELPLGADGQERR
jgi:DNA-binding NarL/FixJ family response regulator